MGRRHVAAAVLVWLSLPLGAAASAQAASPAAPTPPTRPPTSGVGSVTRVSLGPPASVAATRCINTGSDGTVWLLTAGRTSRLVHLTVAGTIEAFPFPGLGQNPPTGQCMAITSDGAVWVSGTEAAAVVRFDPATHSATRYPTPTPGSQPAEMASAPDGTLWFSEHVGDHLGHVVGGRVTEVALPAGTTQPSSLTVTPNGHVWVTVNGPHTSALGTSLWLTLLELSPQGAVLHELNAAHHPVPAISSGLHAYNVDAGPGGLPFYGWGPYPYGVAVVQPGSTEHFVPWPVGDIPSDMRLGPDGRLWFVVANSAFPNYGYIDPTTLRATSFHGPAGLQPNAISGGPGVDMTMLGSDSFVYLVSTGLVQATPLSVSSISAALPTPLQAFADVAVIASSAALAAGATMFITFPAQLFNLTFEENYTAIAGWWGRQRRRWLRRLEPGKGDDPARVGPPATTPAAGRIGARRPRDVVAFGFVVLAGALLGAMLDPRFARTWSTLISIAATCLAILAGATVNALVTDQYHRRTHGVVSRRLRALPLGIAIAAVCVLISRLVSFEPGYLYGVVCGVACTRPLTQRQHGHVAALTALTSLAVSAVAWLVWVPVSHAAATPGSFAGTILAADFLAAVFVSGLVGTAIALLPLRFLPGGAIGGWRRDAWAALFFVTLFALVDIVVRSPVSPGSHGSPLLTTVLLFALFGGFAVVFREYFARRWRAQHGVTVRGPQQWLRDLFTSHA